MKILENQFFENINVYLFCLLETISLSKMAYENYFLHGQFTLFKGKNLPVILTASCGSKSSVQMTLKLCILFF